MYYLYLLYSIYIFYVLYIFCVLVSVSLGEISRSVISQKRGKHGGKLAKYCQIPSMRKSIL